MDRVCEGKAGEEGGRSRVCEGALSLGYPSGSIADRSPDDEDEGPEDSRGDERVVADLCDLLGDFARDADSDVPLGVGEGRVTVGNVEAHVRNDGVLLLGQLDVGLEDDLAGRVEVASDLGSVGRQARGVCDKGRASACGK
jgi:hypothetical protein